MKTFSSFGAIAAFSHQSNHKSVPYETMAVKAQASAKAGNAKPKRKRQRRRRDMSSSSSESSSSEEDSSDEAEILTTAVSKGPDASASSASEAESSSSSESESSSSSSSSEDSESNAKGGTRRGPKNKKISHEEAGHMNGGADGKRVHSRPYPSRSPSPSLTVRNPHSGRSYSAANLPLGTSLFPSLKPLAYGSNQSEGQDDINSDHNKGILYGYVPGDEGFETLSKAQQKGKGKSSDFDTRHSISTKDTTEPDPTKEGISQVTREVEEERLKKFGEWWRASWVSEFEGDLGKLASEPGLTPTRLSLLLSSLNSLSTLHTTSSPLAAESKSIWYHDPSDPIDPLSLAGIPLDGDQEGDMKNDDDDDEADDDGEEWSKFPVGGDGDVEVGEEGHLMDLKGLQDHSTAGADKTKRVPTQTDVSMSDNDSSEEET